MKNVLKLGLGLALCFVISFGVVVPAYAQEEWVPGISWAIEPQWSSAGNFSEGLAAVLVGDFYTDTWAFIDTTGNIVIEPQFSGVCEFGFSEGLAAVRMGHWPDHLWGFINTNGEMVIEPQFAVARHFVDGLASVAVVKYEDEYDDWGNTYWGFIDTAGNMVIEPQFYNAGLSGFAYGFASVQVIEAGSCPDDSRNNWAFIDMYGNEVFGRRFANHGYFSHGGLASVSTGYRILRYFNGEYQPAYSQDAYIIDANGNTVISVEFNGIVNIIDYDLFLLRETFTASPVIVDRDGNELMSVTGFIHPANDGLSRVSAEGYHGFVSVGDLNNSPDVQPAQEDEPDDTQENAPEDAPQSSARTLRFAIDSTTFTDNGTTHTLEAAPFMANDNTMIPLRVIIEAFGVEPQWNDGVITFTLGDVNHTMTIGQPLPNNMGTPVLVAGRTFVPLIYVVEALDGANARWDGNARAAYVYIY